MGKNAVHGQNMSREAKRDRFAAQEQERNGRSLRVVGIGGVVLLVLVAGIVFFLTRPSGAVTLSSPRIISDAAAAPLAQTVVGAGTDAQLVRAATVGHEPYPLAVAENDVVRIPVSTVADHVAHYFTYMYGDKPIEFFILESADGILRAAFNACDVCFLAKKGYSHDGDTVICNNCGLRFPADQINEVRGGCNPSPLERTLAGDFLLIQANDIVNGLKYF